MDLRADSVHHGFNLPNSYTGKNVIIGVTDWGFDYSHPMFYDTALTSTRILAAWDQFKTSGPAPNGMSYGTEYQGETELLAAQSDTACTYYDYATHGSHVAGIAAGGGAGIGLKGVAFESNLLFTAIHLDMASVIDAVNWMKEQADDAGMPLVVNMSWGLYHLGPLDGTSLSSQALDAFALSGVTVVTSGGNNGNDDFHIKKTFNQDSILTRVNFYPYSAHPSMWGQSISMWGEENKPFGSFFEVYHNGVKIAASPAHETNNTQSYIDSVLVIGTDTIYYNLTTESAHPQNQIPHMRLRVKNTHNQYIIILRSYANEGTVHYYNVTELSNGAGNWGMDFSPYGSLGIGGDNLYGIGEPACANDVISVGAHKSETRIPNGSVFPGAIASFSSIGPTVDERVKPDISAPGVSVESSISSYTTETHNPTSSITFNGRTYEFAKFSGTSMSAPATTGVVALMLEANPDLTPSQIKYILQSTARSDNKTGSIPPNGSTQWGFGKVDAWAAVKEASRIVSVSSTKTKNEVFIYPTLVQNQIHINLISKKPWQYKVFDLQGRLIQLGNANNIIEVNDLSSGSYVLHLYNNQRHEVQNLLNNN